MNIFIGNLSFDATESDIKKLFEDFGVVSSVIIVKEKKGAKSRGFGFLTMLDDKQAQAAIAALNNREFMGRPIIVNPERPKLPEELDRREKRRTGPGMSVETKGRPRGKASEQDSWFSPVFKRSGRRSRYERHGDEDTGGERSKPWRKTADQRSEAKPWEKKREVSKPRSKEQAQDKPWQKSGESTKPWRRPEGPRPEARPWQKKREYSKPWQKTDDSPKPWRKPEGSRSEARPWQKKREFSKPWQKADQSPRPWKRTEERPRTGERSKPWGKPEGARPETKPWQKERRFSKPWSKAEDSPKPWKKAEGRSKSWHKPGVRSNLKRPQSYKR